MVNDLIGKVVADKYLVEKLIREADGGDLYLGRHEVLGNEVLLKILPHAYAIDPRWVRRFVGEARSASTVTHPNLLNISDFGTDARNTSYVVYEHTDGRSLREVLAAGEPIDEKDVLSYVRQSADAINAAHDKGLFHAGLTPEHLFVNTDGFVKVLGIGGDPLEVSRDADPRYLAPEQSNAYPSADARTDVYSLGVIFYELLSGEVPFEGTTSSQVAEKQNGGPPAPLSAFRADINREIEPIVLTAMAIDPERRYPTMAAFSEDLATLASRVGEPENAPQVAAAAAAGTSKRNPWQTALFVMAGIAIFAVALIYATSVRQTDPTTAMQVDAASLPVQPIGPATGAQEETLANMPALTEAEIMAQSQGADVLPGGDGYNAWGNNGIPPVGAPLAGSMPGYPSGSQMAPPLGPVQQGGQVYTVDGNGSQFMPDYNTGPVQLIRRDPETGICTDMGSGTNVPCPPGMAQAPKPTPVPKNSPTDPSGQPATEGTPTTAATPKPMATPPAKKPATEQPKTKASPTKPKSGTENDDEVSKSID